MTLETYDPSRIDELALRLLDVAVTLRQISQTARTQGLGHVPLHDRKAQEWLGRLEEWARDADVRVQRAALTRRAQDRAISGRSTDGPAPRGKSRRSSS